MIYLKLWINKQKPAIAIEEEVETPVLPEKPAEPIFVEEIINIQPRPPREYDYLTKKQVLSYRISDMHYLYKGILVDNYTPSEAVFGIMVDKLPWWGFQGLVCKGGKNGGRGNLGASSESRFIENPMFLLGINTNLAFNNVEWDCEDIYPAPQKLQIIPEKKLFLAQYSVSDYEKLIDKNVKIINFRQVKDYHFYHLDGKNARDFGYNYIHVPEFQNIEFKTNEITNGAYKLQDYVGVSRACGLEGGCNNGLPAQDALEFRILSYPAEITAQLYKRQPANAPATPDITYKMYFY